MKLAVILSLVLAFAFLDICSGQAVLILEKGLHSQRVQVPANGQGIVEYRVEYPFSVKDHIEQVTQVLHHDVTGHSTKETTKNEKGEDIYTLKSEPGQGIDAIVTTVYDVQDVEFKNAVHRTIVVPSSTGGIIEHRETFQTANGEAKINIITASFDHHRGSHFDLKIVDGGTGSSSVTILIESDRKDNTEVEFTLSE